MTGVGLVAIGRNEGERFRRCLASLPAGVPFVYVDSGSTDGSPELARQRGAIVVELDLTQPFTAARARNAGWRALLEQHPGLGLVQFLDGDCELAPGWLARAEAALCEAPRTAAVCGRRRERFPDASLYNRLCDLEWAIAVGEVDACGGDAMFRTAALRESGGYDPNLIAGEEPELCLRLRRSGWQIRCIGGEMTVHDAAMTKASQWARRARRYGYALAEGVAMYGRGYPRWRHALRAMGWGAVLPAIALVGVLLLATGTAPWIGGGLLAGIATGVAMNLLRQWAVLRGDPERRGDAWLLACANLLAKLPEAQGIATYFWRRLRRRPPKLIEYKSEVAR